MVSSDRAACSWAFAHLPDWLSPPGTTPVMVWASKTSYFELCCLQKLVVVSPSPFLSQWFGDSFSCAMPCAHFHSFSLPLLLSHSSLHNQGSLPFIAPTVLFSPKSNLCSSYLPQCDCFFLTVDGQFVLCPQIDLLGVQNNLIFT